MSDIHIVRKHEFGKQRCLELAQELGKQLQSSMGGNVQIRGDELLYETRGASGKLLATDEEIEITIKLGLLTKAFKPTIEAEIKRACDKYL